jgi:hypothetical protein
VGGYGVAVVNTFVRVGVAVLSVVGLNRKRVRVMGVRS